MTITRSAVTLAFAAVLAGGLAAPPAAKASAPPTVQIQVDDPWVPEKNSGTSAMTFHVSLSEAAAAPVTVKVATANGSATAPQDYAAVPSTTLTFAPGDTVKAVPVTIVGDTEREGNETLQLKLSKPSANAVLTDTSGLGTMYDGESPRQISVSDFYVVEPAAGEETWVGFTVSLDAIPTAGDPAGVDYTLVPGTAELGSDWDATPLTGFVNLDDESGGGVQVVVRLIGDELFENDETLTIKLSNPKGAVLSDASAVGTILTDDEGPPPGPAPRQISVSDPRVVEANSGSTQARFKVSLDAPATAPVSVKVVTGGGDATAGSDYTALASQTLTFTPGQSSRNVDVGVLGDTLHEGNETFQLKLSKPTGAVLADAAGVATIVDNEGPIVAYMMDGSTVEGDLNQPGNPVILYTRLSSPPDPGHPIELRYTTKPGTATDVCCGGGEYPGLNQYPVTFTTQTRYWSIGIRGDNDVEGDETFSLVMVKPQGVVIGDATGIATIIDND